MAFILFDISRSIFPNETNSLDCQKDRLIEIKNFHQRLYISETPAGKLISIGNWIGYQIQPKKKITINLKLLQCSHDSKYDFITGVHTFEAF